MKNIVSISIVIFLASVILISCKKPDTSTTSTIYDTIIQKDTTRVLDTVRPVTIIGFFTGKIGNNSDYPSFQIAFLFRNDGTVRIYNNNITASGPADTSTIPPAEGTYTVSGDTIRATATYLNNPSNTFSTFSVIDSAFSYMEGTWGSGTINTGGGNYWAYKQF